MHGYGLTEIIQVIVEWVLTDEIAVSVSCHVVSMNTHISCPISRKPNSRNDANAVALATYFSGNVWNKNSMYSRDG